MYHHYYFVDKETVAHNNLYNQLLTGTSRVFSALPLEIVLRASYLRRDLHIWSPLWSLPTPVKEANSIPIHHRKRLRPIASK